MSDPIEFKYVNDSLTTMAQSRLINKLASYIKVPVKTMRSCLDLDKLKSEAVLDFNGLDVSLPSFYLSECRVNINDFLSEKALSKSKFLAEYAIFISKATKTSTLFVSNSPDFMVLDDMAYKGVGGIFIDYPTLNIDNQLLVTIDLWLAINYPKSAE